MVDLTKINNIFLYTNEINFRCGISGLSEIVSEHYTKEDIKNSLFVFFSKSKSQIKILEFENDSIWLYQKKLLNKKFRVPSYDGDSLVIDTRQLRKIIESLDEPVEGYVSK